MKAKLTIMTAVVMAAVSCGRESAVEPVDYVNPYMGNISHLLVPTYPTVQLPNAMLRVAPERADYTSDKVKGLPLLVSSHRGKSVFNLSFGNALERKLKPYYKYSYDNEVVKPYYYSVRFDEDNVEAEFAPSWHSAVYGLKFDGRGIPFLVLHSGNGGLQAAENSVKGFQNIEGKTNAFIFGEFSVAPDSMIVKTVGKGQCVAAYFPEGTMGVGFRYGVSFIDEAQAESNLRKEISGYDVAEVASAGRRIWNRQLSKIKVAGDDDNAKTVFYTSLYRVYERMVCLSEYGRYYSAYDGEIHEDAEPFYTDDWVWDTYRAAHPLRALIDSDKETDMINSYLKMAGQLPQHWMPTFPEVTGDSRRMNCNHAVAIMLDSWRKGLTGFNLKEAYEYARAGITEKTLAPWSGVPKGELTDFYWKNGYIPALKPGDVEKYSEVNAHEKRQPVAVTLGTSYDEWCLAQLAAELGYDEDAVRFGHGCLNYRNLFNPGTLFFHPKDEQGNFIEPFDYERSGGMGGRDAYDENNGWVYRWDVQHNIADLISLFGGRNNFVNELDRTFSTPLSCSKYAFYSQFPDHTGNVGQFSMANEPSLHIPYLYCYAGCPWKTQKRIRNLIDEWFRNDLMGVPGDEDGGGMSAFVAFSMLGFYPVTPGLPMYVIGSPWFEEASVDVGNGNVLEIKCHNYSPDNKYIQSATMDGKPLDRCWIMHSEIADGAKLEFTMGRIPNKEWGTASAPPSYNMDF